jgi:hypothetical protein
MDRISTPERPTDQLSGVLPDSKNQPEWRQKQGLVLALLRWYWGSQLRSLVDELRTLPWRIAF